MVQVSSLEYLNVLGETLSNITELDFMMLDKQLNFLIAPGIEVQSEPTSGVLLMKKLIEDGRPYLVEDTRACPLCQSCERLSNCPYVAVLLLPIKVRGETLGGISFSATSESGANYLVSNKGKLFDIGQKLSEVFAHSIGGLEEIVGLGQIPFRELVRLMDFLSDPVLVINSKGKIVECNSSANKLLQRSFGSLRGLSINNLFDGVNLDKLNKARTVPVVSKVNGCKREFEGAIVPLPVSGEGFYAAVVLLQSRLGHYSTSGYDKELVERELEDIIGESPNFVRVKELLWKVAKSDTTLLLQGETGTGKGLLARAVHLASHRRNGPFVSINCAAIPDTLLESELFGYEEGAFTGAKKSGKPGKLELGNGGTIFLDEIGEMPLHLQVKLLKVLDERVVERIGGTKPIPLDVRVIAATNKNLEQMVQAGKFREDLYFRINVICVNIPPLRERGDDIKLIAQHYLTKIARRDGKKFLGITEEAIKCLESYSWPGNVRELENALEYAASIEPGDYITAASLPPRIVGVKQSFPSLGNEILSIRDIEKMLIREALKQFGSSVEGKSKAAKQLGISMATLYRKLKQIN